MTGLNEIVLISITKCSRLIDMILLLHDNNSYIMLNPLSLLSFYLINDTKRFRHKFYQLIESSPI